MDQSHDAVDLTAENAMRCRQQFKPFPNFIIGLVEFCMMLRGFVVFSTGWDYRTDYRFIN